MNSRCLEKAAIKLLNVSLEDQVKKRWRLCSLAEIESAKFAVRMVPLCVGFTICALVSPIGNTYFVEQAAHLNSQIGKLKVPPQLLLIIFTLAKRLLKRQGAQQVGRFRKVGGVVLYSVMTRAMLFAVLCCITTAKVEARRLKVIRRHDLLDHPNDTIPMGAYWLIFQFALLGGMESLFEKSIAAFFEVESPESMRKYANCFSEGVSGLGYMCSVLSVYVVGKVSEKGGRKSWFQYTLSKSRLDRYYWVLAVLSSVNLLVSIILALNFKYRRQKTLDDEEVDNNTGGSHQLSPDKPDDDGGGLVPAETTLLPIEKGDPLGFIWRLPSLLVFEGKMGRIYYSHRKMVPITSFSSLGRVAKNCTSLEKAI